MTVYRDFLPLPRLAAHFLTITLIPVLILVTPGASAQGQGEPETIHAGSIAEIKTALDQLRDGGTVSIAGGNYDRLDIRDYKAAGLVTLKPADTRNPPIFRSLYLKNTAGMTFDSLAFSRPLNPGEPHYTRMINVLGSRNIQFVGCDFMGSVDGDYTNDPYGMVIGGSTEIVVKNSKFHDLTRAVITAESTKVRLTGNHFSKLRSDGADFAGAQDIIVENNYFANFSPIKGDHPDFIQFWQRNTVMLTKNILIRGNIFLQGTGAPVQSIFMGNKIEGRDYRDIVIEDNIIYTSSIHGVSIYDGVNVRISNNTVLTFPGKKTQPGINLFRTTNAEISRNVSSAIRGKDGETTHLDGNIVVSENDPNDPLHVDRLFVDPGAGADAVRESFLPRPGGALARAGNVGALRMDALKDANLAIIDATTLPGTGRSLEATFDARSSLIAGNKVAANTTFRWDLGDGASATGPVVNHRYAAPGQYRVSLTVKAPSRTLNARKQVTVSSPTVLDLDMRGRSLSQVAAKDDRISVAGTKDGGAYLAIERRDEFFGMKELTLAVAFRISPETRDQRQALLWNHQRYSIELSNGNAIFRLNTRSKKGAEVRIPIGWVYDNRSHTVAMIYDGDSGIVEIIIDGQSVARENAGVGGIEGPGAWNPMVGGTAWGRPFSGTLERVRIITDSNAPL